jgi:hypothetical protein
MTLGGNSEKPPTWREEASHGLSGAICNDDGSTAGVGVVYGVKPSTVVPGAAALPPVGAAVGGCGVDGLDPPPLTGGVKCLSKTPIVLRVALDYLTEFASGKPNESVWLELCEAATTEALWQGHTVTRIRGRFPVLLKTSDGVRIMVGNQGCVLELQGDVLTSLGAQTAYNLGCDLRLSLGGFVPSGWPARADVAVDLNLAERPRVCKWVTGRKGAVPKPNLWGLAPDGSYETLTLGKRGKDSAGLQLQIYDKLLDLTEREHRAAYLENLRCDYAKGGWDGSGLVYRFEVRADRRRMQENNIRICDLLDAPGKLLGLGLGWLTPEGDEVTESLWRVLSDSSVYTLPAPRAARRSSRLPDSDSIVAELARLLARYMAAHDIDDDTDALSRLHYGVHAREANEGLLSDLVLRYRKLYGRETLRVVGGCPDAEGVPSLDKELPF